MNYAMSVPEAERHAYATGDIEVVAMIQATELEMEDRVSPGHQRAIEEVRRLYDALSDCVAEMKAAFPNSADRSDEYDLAISQAETAMRGSK